MQSVVRTDNSGLRLVQFLGVCGRVVVLTIARKRESNPAALFFLLLFLVPPASAQVPGLGVINYFIDLNYVRLLSLCVLLPAFFTHTFVTHQF
jgi:hypothetical protein